MMIITWTLIDLAVISATTAASRWLGVDDPQAWAVPLIVVVVWNLNAIRVEHLKLIRLILLLGDDD